MKNKMISKFDIAYSKLSDSEKGLFNSVFEKKKKKTPYAIMFFFMFGMHYAYLNMPLRFLLFLFSCGGFLLWAIIDLGAMANRVKEANETIGLRIISEIMDARE